MVSTKTNSVIYNNYDDYDDDEDNKNNVNSRVAFASKLFYSGEENLKARYQNLQSKP